MDGNLEDIVKHTKYESYKIFEDKVFDELMCDIQLAECMKSEVSYVVDSVTVAAADVELNVPLDLTVSDSLCCSYCRTTFQDKAEQRNHYKLDWHRHNLKQSLKGMKFLNQEEFSKLADDISSISGSESDSSKEQDLADELASGMSFQKQFIRHPKVFFVNKNNKIVSLYRCILHGKEDIPSSSKELFELAQTCPSRQKWAILMLGGGHFAGAIFNGNSPILHKTFHSYTVRARQGGSQSSRDNRSATSHPRSAGASLRRYNEASFQQHIQDMLDSWSTELEKCHLVFLRAVSHNRSLIFSGKNVPLKKKDPRIRNIPFPTRRATFKEVQRVHGLLSSLELYGSADTFLSSFPISPRITNPEQKQKDIEKSTSSPSSPEKTSSRPNKKIDRGKPRLSPCRPLPQKVEELAIYSSTSSGSEPEFDEIMEIIDFSSTLQEYEDDVPQRQKDKHAKKNKNKKKEQKIENKQSSSEHKVTLSEKASIWCAKVFSVLHDMDLLASVLAQREADGVSETEAKEAINQSIDTRGNTLLHQASTQGLPDRIRLLLEAGVDPAKRNLDKKTPFKVAKNWDTKKAYRKFQADYPEKYNYVKAEVPGPLTEEVEREEEEQHADRKKAQRKARKERLGEKKKLEVEKRKQEEEVRKEKEEQDRFLNLSDREKRALAAERRVLAAGGSVIVRCFLCGSDMTGKVPFSYQSFNFCSMPCLKAHRFQQSKPI